MGQGRPVAMDPSAAFNQFYGSFMAELGLAFPDNPSVDRVRRRFAEETERDPGGPVRALPGEIEPVMEGLMGFDATTATDEATDALLSSIVGRVALLEGMELPPGDSIEEAERKEIVRKNKAAVLDYVRNLGLMAIGLAHMPPGVLTMIQALAADGDGTDDALSVMSMLGPMLSGSGIKMGV